MSMNMEQMIIEIQNPKLEPKIKGDRKKKKMLKNGIITECEEKRNVRIRRQINTKFNDGYNCSNVQFKIFIKWKGVIMVF